MKYLFLSLLCFCNLEMKAQADSAGNFKIKPEEKPNADSGYYNSYMKATIVLKDRSVLHVNQLTTHLNEVSVVYDPKKIPSNPIYNIPVENITYIKFKRDSFLKGLVAGGFIGGFLGAVYGGASYKYDFSESEYNNDESKKLRKLLYGAGGAIPLGLLGGIIGPIIIKKTFYINGDSEKLNKIMKKHL